MSIATHLRHGLGNREDRSQLILIINHDSGLRRALGDVVRVAGYEPHFAATGGAAIRDHLMAGHDPIVVIADLDMPGPEGDAVLTGLAQSSGRHPGVIVVGNRNARVLATQDATVSAVIVKPFSLTDMASAISSAAQGVAVSTR